MSFLDSLKSLFTPAESPPDRFDTQEYKGYQITPTPLAEGNQFRVSGLISKDDREHQFVRADLLGSADACATETLRKAQLTIDQLGDSIFR